MKVEACGDETRGTSGEQKIQAWFGMRFAGLLFDSICRLPLGLGLQVFFGAFCIDRFCIQFQGLRLQNNCMFHVGYDLHAWWWIGSAGLVCDGSWKARLAKITSLVWAPICRLAFG